MEGAVAATSQPTTVTAAGSAHAKGVWAEVVAAAPFDADAFIVRFGRGTTLTANHGRFLLDIGFGPAGQEEVVVANLMLYVTAGAPGPVGDPIIPLRVPAGTRVSVRVQATAANATIDTELLLTRGGIFARFSLDGSISYGANESDSGGVEVDPGAVANTKGSWTEIAASLSEDILFALLSISPPTVPTAMGIQDWLIDLAVGPSVSERVIANDIHVYGEASNDKPGPAVTILPITARAGDRLSARAQCSATTAGTRILDVALIGFG